MILLLLLLALVANSEEKFCRLVSEFGRVSERRKLRVNVIIIIIYHDFLSTPRRGSHVKSGKTHTQSSTYTP